MDSSSSPSPDPLTRDDYLLNPLQTLLASLNSVSIDLHHLSDAYHTLTQRIRFVSDAPATPLPPPALAPLVNHASQLAAVLRRDVRRAMCPMYGTDEDDMKHTIDSITLSHHALYFLADIFRLANMYSVCSQHELDTLLGELFTILTHEHPPLYNYRKTTALAICALSVQLPDSVIKPRFNDFSRIVSILLRDQDHRPLYTIIASDALNCSVNLLRRHEQLALPMLNDLLPTVYVNLTSSCASLRAHAAITLGAFTLSVSSHADSRLSKSARAHTKAFLTTQMAEIRDLMTAALVAQDTCAPGAGLTWALSLVACLPVILGADFFSLPNVLRFTVRCMVSGMERRKELALTVWTTFVWAFAQLRDQHASAPHTEKLAQALKMVAQERHGAVGFAVIGTLLEYDDGWDDMAEWGVARAVEVVRGMVDHSDRRVRAKGRTVLASLVSDIGSPVSRSSTAARRPSWRRSALLAQELFNGSLARVDRTQLPTFVRSMRTVTANDLRPLSEAEITKNWDALRECWMLSVRRYLKGDTLDISDHLSPTWQSLLLVRSQLTQAQGHLTAPPQFASDVAGILIQFLPDPASFSSETPFTPADQAKILDLLARLWAVVRNVFVEPWLACAAPLLLAAVLKRDFSLGHASVLEGWSKLCAGLFAASLADTLEASLATQGEDERAAEMTRHLWGVVALYWEETGERATWRDAVQLLAVPIGSWIFSEQEIDMWGAILEWAVASVPGESAAVIEALVERLLDKKPEFTFLSAMPLTLTLLSHLKLESAKSFPAKTLSMLNDMFLATYQSAVASEYAPRVSEFMTVCHSFLLSTVPELVEKTLVALGPGFSYWIEDSKHVFPDEEFNATIVPLYQTILQCLESLPASLATICTLRTLLIAPFGHIPAPGHGPAAFLAFVENALARIPVHINEYPEEMRICYAELVLREGGTLPAGMVVVSSQTQTEGTDVFQGSGSYQRSSQAWALRSPRAMGPEGFRSSVPPMSPVSASLIDNGDRRVPSPSTQVKSSRRAEATKRKALPEATEERNPAADSNPIREPPAKRQQLEKPPSEPYAHAVPAPRGAIKGAPATSHTARPGGVQAPSQDSTRQTDTGKRSALEASVSSDASRIGPVVARGDYAAWEVTPVRPRKAWKPSSDSGAVPETPQAYHTAMEHNAVQRNRQDNMHMSPSHLMPALSNSQATRYGTAQRTLPLRTNTASAPASLPTPTSSPIDPSQARGNGPGSAPPPLRRANTTSAKLTALQQAHATLTDPGLSQLAIPELVDAAKMLEDMHMVVNGQMRRTLGGGHGQAG